MFILFDDEGSGQNMAENHRIFLGEREKENRFLSKAGLGKRPYEEVWSERRTSDVDRKSGRKEHE
jgi:hypothetical protein